MSILGNYEVRLERERVRLLSQTGCWFNILPLSLTLSSKLGIICATLYLSLYSSNFCCHHFSSRTPFIYLVPAHSVFSQFLVGERIGTKQHPHLPLKYTDTYHHLLPFQGQVQVHIMIDRRRTCSCCINSITKHTTYTDISWEYHLHIQPVQCVNLNHAT